MNSLHSYAGFRVSFYSFQIGNGVARQRFGSRKLLLLSKHALHLKTHHQKGRIGSELYAPCIRIDLYDWASVHLWLVVCLVLCYIVWIYGMCHYAQFGVSLVSPREVRESKDRSREQKRSVDAQTTSYRSSSVASRKRYVSQIYVLSAEIKNDFERLCSYASASGLPSNPGRTERRLMMVGRKFESAP